MEMKVYPYYRLIIVVLLFIVCLADASAQAPVKISNEKVSIDGVAYYIHIVGKGQTLYSISKAYHVTTEVLLKENRTAIYGLSEGDPLKIPVVMLDDPEIPDNERDNDKYIYHTLQPGETVFALSRKYNIPEESIIESNPDVNVFDLPVGSEIAIPRKKFKEEHIDFQTDEYGFILHKVLRGESLSDIADHYDISVREIRNANKRLIFPKTGDYLRIPADEGTNIINPIADPAEVDSLLLKDENITLLFDGSNVDFTAIDELDGDIDVVLMLPLYLKENRARTYIDSSEYNSSGRKIYRTVRRPDDWIYPRSENFIEYYEGVLLAVDKLKSNGLSVNLTVYDTYGSAEVVDSLLENNRFRDVDLILGPVYSYNVEQVARYARRYRIPVVSPLATGNSEVLGGNPYLFKAQPSMEIVEEAMARTISEYHDYNLVFVHSDTSWSDNLSQGFKNIIYRKLRYVTPLSEINFREVLFSSSSNYNDTINIIDHALRKDIPNLIIIASSDEAVMTEVVVNAHTLLRNYDIEVIGFPEMRWLDNLDPLYFYDLGAMIFSPNWVDYTQGDVKEFIRKFRAKFNMEPPIRSYAWQSYDLSLYFMSGVALHGNSFMYNPGSHRPDLLQVDYKFRRTGLRNGYENNRLFLLKYTPEMTVEFPHFEEIEDNWE
jgi:LysM repeat protein/ABC-type branched-subunit amino acid transport system substrate-binding protein